MENWRLESIYSINDRDHAVERGATAYEEGRSPLTGWEAARKPAGNIAGMGPYSCAWGAPS